MSDPAQVRIVNTALNALGQEPVTDLTDASLDGSVAAVKILRVLDTARETVLARHGWVCALEYDTLSPSVIPGAANFRYPTVFLVPGNSLRVWEIDGDPWNGDLAGGWGPRWQVGTIENGASARTIIRASSGAFPLAGGVTTLNIAYVRLANWQALDAHVADAVAFDAAARAAASITGEISMSDKMAKKAEQQVMIAIGIDGTQEGGQPPLAPSIPAAIRNRSR